MRSVPTVAVWMIYTVSQKNCTPKAGQHNFIKISSPMMIFHTRHRHSVADQFSSKSLVRVEYQLQGFHGNQTLNNRMLFIIAYNWRHHNKTHSFYTEWNSLQNVYFGFFCIWKITEFMPTCLRGAVFFETQCMYINDITQMKHANYKNQHWHSTMAAKNYSKSEHIEQAKSM